MSKRNITIFSMFLSIISLETKASPFEHHAKDTTINGKDYIVVDNCSESKGLDDELVNKNSKVLITNEVLPLLFKYCEKGLTEKSEIAQVSKGIIPLFIVQKEYNEPKYKKQAVFYSGMFKCEARINTDPAYPEDYEKKAGICFFYGRKENLVTLLTSTRLGKQAIESATSSASNEVDKSQHNKKNSVLSEFANTVAPNEPDYFPFYDKVTSMWGLINARSGAISLKPHFKHRPTTCYKGRFFVDGDLYGIEANQLKKLGTFKDPDQFLFDASICYIENEEKVINRDGKIIYNVKNGEILFCYMNGLAVLVDQNKKLLGYVDTKGKEYRLEQSLDLHPILGFSEGILLNYDSNNNIVALNTKCEVLFKIPYSTDIRLSQFEQGYAILEEEQSFADREHPGTIYKIIDKKGKVYTLDKATEILKPFSSNMFIIRKLKKTPNGYTDVPMRVFIEKGNLSMQPLSNDRYYQYISPKTYYTEGILLNNRRETIIKVQDEKHLGDRITPDGKFMVAKPLGSSNPCLINTETGQIINKYPENYDIRLENRSNYTHGNSFYYDALNLRIRKK